MIPMSSRWQNFPDRHFRRVLYPGGREQQSLASQASPATGTAMPSQHLGHLRTFMCHARAVCAQGYGHGDIMLSPPA